MGFRLEKNKQRLEYKIPKDDDVIEEERRVSMMSKHYSNKMVT